MEPVIIILGVVIILLVVFLYVNYWKQTVLFEKLNLNQAVSSIPESSLSKSGSLRHAYGVWIYVNSWNNQNIKTIFERGSPSNIKLYLEKTSPELKCDVQLNNNTTSTISITNNFPIQKWTYVIVSVDSKIVDFYIDGKLILSKQLVTLPAEPSGDISMGGSTRSDIFLARFYRWTNPMDPQTAWNEYLNGTGESMVLPNYNVQLELLKDNVVNKKYSLF